VHNIICFPHYTAGGLLCDILSDTYSTVGENGGINSIRHELGKIGDSDTVFDKYDPAELLSALDKIKIIDGSWIGTHCWPGLLDVSRFNQIVNITTTTYRSKLYRWIRAYYHYYEKSEPWQHVSGMDRLDKERETAKNYIKPFLPVMGPNIINIEFAEIVEESQQFHSLLANNNSITHMERWKQINDFLYDKEIWNSAPLKRYYEAELEVNLNQYYIYN
jgi:hypothetical protein